MHALTGNEQPWNNGVKVMMTLTEVYGHFQALVTQLVQHPFNDAGVPSG